MEDLEYRFGIRVTEPKRGSVNHVVISIAPLSAKRSLCLVWVSR